MILLNKLKKAQKVTDASSKRAEENGIIWREMESFGRLFGCFAERATHGLTDRRIRTNGTDGRVRMNGQTKPLIKMIGRRYE